jgi:tetratricopeptide (TPR) repeat protein
MTNARLEELRAKFQENPRRYFAPFANELRKGGDPVQAISVCRAHLAGQPGHVSGHIVLGQALYEAGEGNEARDVFTAALDLDPENLIALRTLGEIAQVNGEFSTARQWYERLLDADPRNPEVAQLLKDMPAEAPRATVASEPVADVVEEPTPLTIRQEIEEKAAEPDETPRSTFHTSFTGSSRAYEPMAPEPEDALSESSKSSDEAFIDLEPSAQREPAEEVVNAEPPLMAAAEAESIDMVDFDTMPQAAVEEAAIVNESPDESFETFETHASAEAFDVAGSVIQHFEQSLAEETGEVEMTGTSFDAAAEPSSAEEPAEPPRAMFAERGFDGPIEEDYSWMTTPSAALSDPEAAPEDWFDESAMAEAEDVVIEQSAENPSPAAMSQPDHTNDSWFDEVDSAEAIESAEVTSDELWLPPELPRFAAAEDAVPPSARFSDESVHAADTTSAQESPVEEPLPDVISSFQAPNDTIVAGWSPAEDVAVSSERFDDQAESPWMQREEISASIDAPDEGEAAQSVPAAEQEEPVVAESAGFDVHAIADAADEAFLVERPDESSSVPTFEAEPQQLQEAVEPYEPVSMEADVEVFHASVDARPEAAHAYDVVGHMPETAEAQVSVPPAPFVTETLAELYLQQGFRDEALSIYRQLVVREPDNQGLKDRIAAIEKGDVPQGSQTPEIPAEERAASQSVRTFFSRLARRPAAPPNQEMAVGPTPSSATPDVPFAAAASALANLFSASMPPAADEGAASTLAGAYSDPAGRPSRAADRELSLDHLFRDVPPGGSPTGGVTLDEFYSTPNASQGSPTEPGEVAGSEESGGADIRQFTAWLEGLRKK